MSEYDQLLEHSRNARLSWSTACAALSLLLCAATFSGCAKSEMQFYFAAADLGDQETPRLKFYRVTVHGQAGGQTSNLLTGFYDSDALHSLFGQVEAPNDSDTSGRKPASSSHHVGNIIVQYDPVTKGWRALQDDEKFTVFWGTNADAMAQQVSAFAQSEQAGGELASILAAAAGRDKFDALRTAQSAASDKDTARTKLAEALTALKGELDSIAEADIPAKIKKDLLENIFQRAANATLIAAGSSKILPSDHDKAMEAAKSEIDRLR